MAHYLRSLRPDRYVLDRGDDHWRGGQITAINGGTTTIKLLAEQHWIVTLTRNTSLVAADARSVGCPVYCKVSIAAVPYTILEAIGSAAPGEFWPGIIPRELTGEPDIWWESAWSGW